MSPVLIFRTGSLGDTVVALPSLHVVAAAFRDRPRLLLTQAPGGGKAASIQAVLEHSGLVDGFLDYDPALPWWREARRIRRRVRELGADTLVYLAPRRTLLQVLRDRLFFSACGLRRIIGIPLQGRHQIRPPAGARHPSEASRLLGALASLGSTDLESPAAWDLHLTPGELASAEQALAIFPPDQPILAVSLGTKQPANDWGLAKWTELISRLAPEFPQWGLLLIGASQERDSSERAARGWLGPRVNLCGVASPRVASAALKRARLFIGHDSGPLHLAAASGVRCIGIFGARNPPGLWFPHGPGHLIFYREVPCAGCGLSACPPSKGHACLASIPAEEVLDAARRAMASGGGS